MSVNDLNITGMESDLHPHDPVLSRYFSELLIAFEQLEKEDGVTSPTHFNDQLIAALLAVSFPQAFSTPRSAALDRLSQLLTFPDFETVLPIVLERLNTPARFVRRPRRGRTRNVERSQLDTFYTPLDVAKWLSSLTTARACDRILETLNQQMQKPAQTNVAQALHQLLSLKVGDLSCGSGVLLREAATFLANTYERMFNALTTDAIQELSDVQFYFFKRRLFKLQCLANNLYGVDLSSKAIESAQLVLLLWAASEIRMNPTEIYKAVNCLKLNFREGSGAHWSVGLNELQRRDVVELCFAASERRLAQKRAILSDDSMEIRAEPETNEIVCYFPEVFTGISQGFGCLVGNPPYGKLPEGYERQVLTGNGERAVPHSPLHERLKSQYSKFISALVHLLAPSGFGAMVAPLGASYTTDPSARQLRREIQRQAREWCFVFFDRSPDSLFGDMVKTRNMVIFCSPTDSAVSQLKTTHLIRWTRASRATVWDRISPVAIDQTSIERFIPKLGSPFEVEAWRTLRSQPSALDASLHADYHDEESTVYCYSTAYNWLPVFRSNPNSYGQGEVIASPSTRAYRFNNAQEADFFYACLVSSVSFWLWAVESDGFHLSDSFIAALPYSPQFFSAKSVSELCRLGREHDQIIRKYPLVKANAGRQILNFDRHKADAVVQRIDEILISALGIPNEFRSVLKDRISELIFAGRSTTRRHILSQNSEAETRAAMVSARLVSE
jgi:hypothetical protein